MTGASLSICCTSVLGLLSIAYLTILIFSSLGVAYKRENLSLLAISICLLQLGLLFLISILSYYGIDEIFKCVNNFLELYLLEKVNLPLIFVLISISMLEKFWTIGIEVEALELVEKNLFANSLIGTTIQDSSKKKRSNDVY